MSRTKHPDKATFKKNDRRESWPAVPCRDGVGADATAPSVESENFNGIIDVFERLRAERDKRIADLPSHLLVELHERHKDPPKVTAPPTERRH